ncbi:MAG: hypothetical protein AAF353_09845 [Pseudomonadota bacterium]
MKTVQKGFTLIAAIFLLVVVSGLVVYISNITTVQHTTLLYGVQGARAYQAARSGLEWGISRSLAAGTCPATSTFPIPVSDLRTMSVQVSCTETTHTEGSTAIQAYRLTSIASSGTFGSLDYVQRRIQATVSLDPP